PHNRLAERREESRRINESGSRFTARANQTTESPPSNKQTGSSQMIPRSTTCWEWFIRSRSPTKTQRIHLSRLFDSSLIGRRLISGWERCLTFSAKEANRSKNTGS